jgi:serine/threonine-protein kinase
MLVCPRCGASFEDSIPRCPFDATELAVAPDALVGTHVAGRYRVEAAIGRGTYAAVYRATDPEGRAVALKVLHAGLARSAAVRERFEREARAMARVSHPGVVPVLDVLEGGLVMPLYPGTLADRLARGPLSSGETIGIVAAIARALAAAHAAGVVHRDLKPANVCCAEDGAPVVVDFGLARVQGEVGLTASGDLVGSPSYMAPELVRGELPTPAVDHYALGCIWFELLSGRPPFTGSAGAVLDAHLDAPAPSVGELAPAEHARLLAELLAKAPTLRAPAAAALAAYGTSAST